MRNGARADDSRLSGDEDGIRLSDAPSDRARRAGVVPDLRNGARAARHYAGGRREPRTERYEAPVLGERGFDAAGFISGDVGDDSGSADSARAPTATAHVHSIRAGHAGRVVGRMAVLRARMGFDRQS